MRCLVAVCLLLASNWSIATETYKCIYTSYSDQTGVHKEELSLTFLYDTKTDKAYIIGNNGSNEVLYIYRGYGKSFVEVTGAGNIMVTTIDSKMNSVHSRNSVGFSGELVPSQFYGRCVTQ